MDSFKLTKNLLFIDIETVSGQNSYDELSPGMQKLWAHKASFLKNEEDISVDQQYFDRAGIYAEFGKIIVIGLGFFYKQQDELLLKVKTLAGHNEKDLLLAFKDLLDNSFKNKDLQLCAHNGKEFDFPYLCRRMLVNGIKLPKILDFSGRKPWEVPHLDTLELWKFGDRKHYTSLDMLANLFGIQSSKNEMSGDEVNQVYYADGDLEKIRKYCLDDVVVLAQLYLKLHALAALEESQIERIYT